MRHLDLVLTKEGMKILSRGGSYTTKCDGTTIDISLDFDPKAKAKAKPKKEEKTVEPKEEPSAEN